MRGEKSATGGAGLSGLSDAMNKRDARAAMVGEDYSYSARGRLSGREREISESEGIKGVGSRFSSRNPWM